MWDQATIIFLMRAIQTSLDNSFTQRIQLGHKKLLQFQRKKLAPLPRAFFIHVEAALNLLLHCQKHARNH